MVRRILSGVPQPTEWQRIGNQIDAANGHSCFFSSIMISYISVVPMFSPQ
jgi:hypothetical protein